MVHLSKTPASQTEPRALPVRILRGMRALLPLLALVSLISPNLSLIAAQGRLLSSVIGLMCILMAIGLHTAIPYLERARPFSRSRRLAGFAIVMAGFNLSALFGVIAPASS